MKDWWESVIRGDHLPRACLMAWGLVIIGVALMVWPEEQRLIGWLTMAFATVWMVFEVGLSWSKEADDERNKS